MSKIISTLNRILVLFFSYYALFVTLNPILSHAQAPGPPDPPIFNCEQGFTDLGSGILHKQFSTQTPITNRLQNWHIVKVPLTNPIFDFMVTPDDETPKGLGTTTGDFASNYGTALAINGDLFYPSSFDPLGLAVAADNEYSSVSGEPSIFISEENEISFWNLGGNPRWDAISGSHRLVSNGDINEKFDNISVCPGHPEYCLDTSPRTGMGVINGSGGNPETLVIMVLDGRQPGLSQGAPLDEFAMMFLQCGIDDAINMDGGGSSTLIGPGGLMNSPSDGFQRIVANHFGICIGPCDIGTPPPLPPPLPGGNPRPRFQPGSSAYPFPCDQIAPNNSSFLDDEFHSLRPYQASPCNQNYSDLALFCGDNITIGSGTTIVKKFTNLPTNDADFTFNGVPVAPQPPSYGSNPCKFCDSNRTCVNNSNSACIPDYNQCESDADCGTGCELSADGKTEKCSFTISETKTVSVDLSGAEFPVMGYTEPSVGNEESTKPKVVNSVFDNPEDETLDDVSKVNEYVSWYLHGVEFRAEGEYPDIVKNCIGETTELPGICIDQLMSNETNDCTQISENQIEDGPGGCSIFTHAFPVCCVDPDSQIKDSDNYNIINLSGPINKLLPQRIQFETKEAQITAGFETKWADTNVRHNQTAGCVYDLNPLGLGLLGIPVPCYQNFFDPIYKDTVRLSHWQENVTVGALPPREEDPNFNSSTEYTLAFKEWRGKWCIPIGPIPIPIIGDWTFYWCLNNPIQPDFWAELFPYIPYASTEDRLGKVIITGTQYQVPSPNFRVITMTITNSQPAKLFVPHMEEAAGTSEILQKTYAPEGTDLNNMTNSGSIPFSPYCSFAQVRTNPGDDLFATALSATVNYTAQAFCTFDVAGNGNLCEQLTLNAGDPDATCVAGNLVCEKDYGQLDCADGLSCGSGNCIPEINPIQDAGCKDLMDQNFGRSDGLCYPTYYDKANCDVVLPSSMDPCDPGLFCGANCILNNEVEISTDLTCSNTILVTMKTQTQTPLADKVWAKLVAGSAGVVRRMFPKIGVDGVFGGLYDIPTGTSVIYSSSADTTFAGDPAAGKAGGLAQLYFPHIGGIKEYFLTGIQTLLRPAGFGKKIVYCDVDDPACLGDGSFNNYFPPGGGGIPGGGGGVCNSEGQPPAVPPAPVSAPLCQPATVGWCSPEMIEANWPSDVPATSQDFINASIVCNGESGGWTNAMNDGCLCGKTVDYSIGLFQINLLAHCAGAFSSYTWNPPSCVIGDETILNECKTTYFDPAENINYAAHLWDRSGRSWSGPWSVAKVCGLP